MMPLPKTKAESEYDDDIQSGRRIELRLSNNCLLTLQYYPEFSNISLSFYTKDAPGFTIGLPSKDWHMIQEVIAEFNWIGMKH
jgi:hypothetical protein